MLQPKSHPHRVAFGCFEGLCLKEGWRVSGSIWKLQHPPVLV